MRRWPASEGVQATDESLVRDMSEAEASLDAGVQVPPPEPSPPPPPATVGQWLAFELHDPGLLAASFFQGADQSPPRPESAAAAKKPTRARARESVSLTSAPLGPSATYAQA